MINYKVISTDHNLTTEKNSKNSAKWFEFLYRNLDKFRDDYKKYIDDFIQKYKKAEDNSQLELTFEDAIGIRLLKISELNEMIKFFQDKNITLKELTLPRIENHND